MKKKLTQVWLTIMTHYYDLYFIWLIISEIELNIKKVIEFTGCDSDKVSDDVIVDE